MGKAHKYADKWGKEGVNVWHERWGEDYDGVGGCTKWTDKVCLQLLAKNWRVSQHPWFPQTLMVSHACAVGGAAA